MNAEQNANSFYRCQISAEHSKAVLVGCGLRIPVVLCESAIDGFTVTIAEKHVRRLQLGRIWVLKTKHERNRVHPEWVFHARGQTLQLGLRRVSEIVQSDEPKGGIWSYFSKPSLLERSNYAELGFAALLMTIFVMLSTPFVGSKLGTERPIHEFASSLGSLLSKLIR